MFGKKKEPKAPKTKVVKERKPFNLGESLRAFGRNTLLVASVAAIVVLAVLFYGLVNRASGGTMPNAALAGGALILVGGSLTLWLGRKWGMIPF